MRLPFLIFIVGCHAASPTASPPAVSWPDGCFVYKTAAGALVESDHVQCSRPRRPYSTFKLANALIAVDAGVFDNADSPMTWDKTAIPDDPDWPDVWRKPHTLRTGIAVSAVPYFRTLALTLGAERMHAGLAKLDYGNQDMSGGLDLFWLRGGLRISALEQLAFVDAIARGTLAVSAHAQEVVRDISIKDHKGTATLHGKTGTGPPEAGGRGWLVWQVGWVDNTGAITPYAAWLELPEQDVDKARATLQQRLLATLAEKSLY